MWAMWKIEVRKSVLQCLLGVASKTATDGCLKYLKSQQLPPKNINGKNLVWLRSVAVAKTLQAATASSTLKKQIPSILSAGRSAWLCHERNVSKKGHSKQKFREKTHAEKLHKAQKNSAHRGSYGYLEKSLRRDVGKTEHISWSRMIRAEKKWIQVPCRDHWSSANAIWEDFWVVMMYSTFLWSASVKRT